MTDKKNTSGYIQELTQYLHGLKEDMPETFFRLAEVLKHEAFELCQKKGNGEYLIPYMMNDAVEYYLILRNSRLVGEFLADEKVTFAHIAKNLEQYLLVIRQESGNTCTVTFGALEEACT